MNKTENETLLKLAESIARLETDVKYIREHVSVMNSELGECIGRLDSLEKCNAERKGQEKQKSRDWKLIFGVAGTTGAVLTAIYYGLIIAKVI